MLPATLHTPHITQARDGVKRYMLPAHQIKNARTHYEHAHAHDHAHAHAHGHSRSMAATATETNPSMAAATATETNPDDWVCEPAAYAYNARRVQDINTRKIYSYAEVA
jgi:hypothetical protein